MSAQTVEINSVETVLRELAPLVEEVQRTLEQSLESDEPAAGAEGVTNRLREIQGTLQLLDLDGPTLLVRELRALANALAQGQVEGQESALEVLLKGVFKLPDYLDHIQAGRPDRPAVLLPLINELRAASGQQALGERDVFKPRLEPVTPRAVGAPEAAGEIQATAKRLRPRFQRALLGWYQGNDVQASLDELGSVLQELAKATSSPATERLWRVCGALTESLSDQGLEQDTSVKVLMAKVERLLSQLVREGEAALERTIPLDLLRSLLYYVARSGSDSPRVREVKEAYQLEELLPDSGAEADFEGPNRGLLEVVGQGIRDDLASIRDAVEIYVHSEERRPDVLEGLPERIKQVADTFSMVGLSEDHDILRREADALADIESLESQEADERMQALADVLVRADSDLTALESGRPVHASASDEGALPIRDLPDSEYRPLLSAVVAAALDDLSKLREAIGAYCGDPEAGHEAVAEAPSLLAELEGAVAMLPLESALPLTQDLRGYVERELVERGKRPDDDTQVLLADVVAGLEYYLEAVDHDRAAMTHLLESAARAVEALRSGGEPETHSDDEQVVIESPPAEELEEPTEQSPEQPRVAAAAPEAGAPMATAEQSEESAPGDDEPAPGEPAAAEGLDELELSLESESDASEPPSGAPPETEELDVGDLDMAGPWDTASEEPAAESEGVGSGGAPDALDIGDLETGDLEAVEPVAAPTEGVDTKAEGEASSTPSDALDIGDLELVDTDTGGDAGVDALEASPDEALSMATADEHERTDTGDIPGAEAAPTSVEDSASGSDDWKLDDLELADVESVGAPTESNAADAPAETAIAGETGSAVDDDVDLDAGDLELEAETAVDFSEESATADTGEASLESESAGGQQAARVTAGEDAPAAEVASAEAEQASPEAETGSADDTESSPSEGEDGGGRAGPGVDPEASGSQYAIVGEDVDDEIVEVFLEEALGELDKINEYLPKWKANPSDEESLVVVRRAFHTLKGGGRLIGAELVGEFSWSMENMLNRVIDHSIDATPVLFDTLDEAAAALPQLIEQIRGNRAPIAGIDNLIQRAHALSRGEEPPPGGGGGSGSGDTPSNGGAASEAGSASERADSTTDAQQTSGASAEHDPAEAMTASAEASETVDADPGRSEDQGKAEASDYAVEADNVGASDAPAADPDATLAEQPTTAGDDLDLGDAAAFDLAAPDFGADDAHDSKVRGAGVVDDSASAGARDDGLDREAPSFDATSNQAPPHEGGNGADDRVELELDDPDGLVSEDASRSAEEQASDETGEALSAADPVNPEEIDEELIESFLEEGDELLEACDDAVSRWRDQPDDEGVVAEIQRHLHTLKGGARMADLTPLGELTHELESLVHAAQEGTCQRDEPFFDVLHQGVDALTAMLTHVRARQPIGPAEEVLRRVRELRMGGAPQTPASAVTVAAPAEVASEADHCNAPEARSSSSEGEASPPADPGQAEATETVGSGEPVVPYEHGGGGGAEPTGPEEEQPIGEGGGESSADIAADDEFEDELVDSFLEEADELIETCDGAVARWREDPHDRDAPAELQRALHTLKGGARMANLHSLGELTHELESLIHAVEQGSCDRNEALYDALQESVDTLTAMLTQVRARKPLATPDELVRRLESLRHGEVPGAAASGPSVDATAPAPVNQEAMAPAGRPAETDDASEASTGRAKAEAVEQAPTGGAGDDDIVTVFAKEAQSHLHALREAFLESDGTPAKEAQPVKSDVLRALHTLVGSAETAGVDDMAAVAGPMEEMLKLRRDAKSDLTGDDVAVLGEAVATLERMLEHLQGHTTTPAELGDLPHRVAAQRDNARADLEATRDESEDELVDVFLEEADELLEACDQGVARWRENPDDSEVTSELQRSLHTLKGGARMAHLPPIADLTHEVESVIKAVDEGTCGVGEELFDLLQEAVDALTVLLEQVRGRQPVARVNWLVEDLQNLRERGGAGGTRSSEPASSTSGSANQSAPTSAESAIEPDTEQAAEEPAGKDESAAPQTEQAGKQGGVQSQRTEQGGDGAGGGQAGQGAGQSQSAAEQIRVRSDLLDNLVNYAGEVSIYHSRLGEQMGQYRFNLNEFEQTVNRLREQLRQMEDETEAQILYSGEKGQEDQPRREDFDPLEFDRYTRIQELSRSLAESVGDLDSIKEILENLTRDAETLLQQQSRVSSELQDGLMQTRMVRFDGLRARLSRVVRQTASQVGKKVQMTMTGGELEVDRSIQERVVAPLEHVLRNAVSHGIEGPSDRRKAGKPEQGTISIDLHRGGTDVVLEISDDGSGIDPEAVRQKAIKRGLIGPDDDRDDNEVIKLILETGFSTADEVTQISGRGVGMDVVDAEIRRLGGTLGISTVKGQGTRFTIRLPVTLAINQAVLVKAGDDTYAIPIASIEGVTQVTAGDLKEYYIDPSKRLTYAEAEYRVQHLGAMLGTSEPKLDDPNVSYPVIMVRAGDDRVALHIESIQGRREVVVKPLGTPLNMLPGISGATIMADGSVVLILDVGGLLRTESRFVAAEAPMEAEPSEPGEVETEEEQGERTPTILVVDDSITMRKVSQRILSRNGLEVATAKDGVDAMSWMAERVPDLILLDIEMPRMDGYEVASNVRSDNRLKDVPIIMVTSRTGDKHRQRAEDIGVNQYLGKPYQEGELMEEINRLIGRTELA